jgi:hypothetical protein
VFEGVSCCIIPILFHLFSLNLTTQESDFERVVISAYMLSSVIGKHRNQMKN